MEASFKTSSITSNDITVASAYYMNARYDQLIICLKNMFTLNNGAQTKKYKCLNSWSLKTNRLNSQLQGI